MNRLEFNEVMHVVGIDNPITTKMTMASSVGSEKVHRWQNIDINFSGSYYAVINGKIPLEVASIIYEKYPNNPYEIRVNGGCSDWNPEKYAVDDKYENVMDEIVKLNLPTNEYLTKFKNARKSEDKYIQTYHIDTKEGLVILLTEMKDYYARKAGLPETEAKRFDELMNTINSEILKKVNPTITAYEWMQEDKENNKIFLETISKGTKNSFGKEFRRVIDAFDKTINPFTNKDIELDEIGNYLQKVSITASIYNLENEKKRDNCGYVYIKDLETKNHVYHYRTPNGFIYSLQCMFNGQYLEVYHYYATEYSDENDNGEIIAISYHGDKNLDIRLNLTKCLAGTTYGEKTPVSKNQVELVYNELLAAIEIASSITIKNMAKKNYSKKLLK